jgi:N-acetylmuramoyl-L-alanine amidase
VLILGLIALVAVGCRRGTPTLTEDGGESKPSLGTSADPLPHRAEVVARADALALAAARDGGPKAGEQLRQAADLRTRVWRAERREPDALEALELYSAAARLEWPGACEADIDRALLEAELRSEPAPAYRAVYLLKAKSPHGVCGSRADAALTALAAYQPIGTAMIELERRARPGAEPSLEPEGASKLAGPVVVPELPPGKVEPARITSVERYGARDAARIVVNVTRPTVFSLGHVVASNGRGPRLFVDIAQATFDGPSEHDVGGIVQRVRLGKQKDGTRVVLDLEEDVYRKAFYLPEPFRLVIDVSKQPPGQDSAQKGPRPLRRVVLDPGHGGHDPGAIGPTGLREKDVTLDIAHRAAPLIARELGVVTLLTRDADDYLTLEQRTAKANAFSADLFISIHCNASEDSNAHGVMTFVFDESRDVLSLHVAARENDASPAAATEIANRLSKVIDARSIDESVRFAGLLQRSAVASLSPGYGNIGDQGIKRAGFYVLAGARMPAVLFEVSFISHPIGEMRLSTADYRQKLADSLVNAVRAYRDGLGGT